MQVSFTELKANLGEYLDLLGTGDIIITRNGRKIARLVKERIMRCQRSIRCLAFSRAASCLA